MSSNDARDLEAAGHGINRLVVISGCSGGGKSTLLSELAGRGHAVVEEPGRRVIAQESRTGGSALPWVNMAAFARRAMDLARADRAAAVAVRSWVFFDRGLIDAAAALEHATGEPVLASLAQAHRYNRQVFLTPPWPEIYAKDADRRHDLGTAIAEYERLLAVYPALGYEVVLLPKTRVEARAAFVLDTLAA